MPDKCKTRQQIAEEYGIDRKTLAKLLKSKQLELPRGILTPEWTEQVYAALGKPEKESPPPDSPLTRPAFPKIPQLSPKFPNLIGCDNRKFVASFVRTRTIKKGRCRSGLQAGGKGPMV